MLDAGALVETLETATFWSSVRPLHEAVSAALRDSLSGQGTPPMSSATYRTYIPAELRCTSRSCAPSCLTRSNNGVGQRLLQMMRSSTPEARSATIMGSAAIIVKRWPRRSANWGSGYCAAIKRTLDPAGILNPGIVIAARYTG